MMARHGRVALLMGFSVAVFGQDAGRNTVTVGFGGGFPAGGYRTAGFSSGPAVSVGYEFRLFKYLAPEVAVVNVIPNALTDTEFTNSPSRERVTFISLGVRGIAPLREDSIELFAGLGSAHLGSTNSELIGYSLQTWLLQIGGGGRVAVDRCHRFWIGPTVRLSRDTGRPTVVWVSLSGEVGFRF
jgi:hypothetical protein